MGKLQIPDIPAPRLSDEGYMRLWHKYMYCSTMARLMERQRDFLRKAAFVLASVFISLVICLYGLLTS